MRCFHHGKYFSGIFGLFVFLVLVAGTSCVIFAFEPPMNPARTAGWLLGGAFLLAVAWRAIPVAASAEEFIEVDDDGIHVLDPDGEEEDFLRWEQIAYVTDRPGFQALEFYDRQGRRCLVVDYFLERFEDFEFLVFRHVGEVRRRMI
ncbi:MAG: hypothetical protein RLY93_19995 [Sumerlaeia bacterium]